MSLQTQPAAPLPSQAGGRLTMPIQTGMDAEIRRLIARLGADAVRNAETTPGPTPTPMRPRASSSCPTGSPPLPTAP